jgi:hypothetical protein
MLRRIFTLLGFGVGVGLALASLGASATNARPMGMLKALDLGGWQLRTRGAAGRTQNLCIRSGREFIQLRHPGLDCSYTIVDDKPTELTVHYTCRGQGFGRTHLRMETSRLMQIESQGVVRGKPFSFVGEARKSGPCQG